MWVSYKLLLVTNANFGCEERFCVFGNILAIMGWGCICGSEAVWLLVCVYPYVGLGGVVLWSSQYA